MSCNRRQGETQHDRLSFVVNESIQKSQLQWNNGTRLGNLGKYPLPPGDDSSGGGGVGSLPNYIFRNSENGIWAHPKEKYWLHPCS